MEMTHFESIVKALECAIDPTHNNFKDCNSCAYRKDVDHLQYVCDGDRCIADALDLLRSQRQYILENTHAIPVEWLQKLLESDDSYTRGAAKWILGCWKRKERYEE